MAVGVELGAVPDRVNGAVPVEPSSAATAGVNACGLASPLLEGAGGGAELFNGAGAGAPGPKAKLAPLPRLKFALPRESWLPDAPAGPLPANGSAPRPKAFSVWPALHSCQSALEPEVKLSNCDHISPSYAL